MLEIMSGAPWSLHLKNVMNGKKGRSTGNGFLELENSCEVSDILT